MNIKIRANCKLRRALTDSGEVVYFDRRGMFFIDSKGRELCFAVSGNSLGKDGAWTIWKPAESKWQVPYENDQVLPEEINHIQDVITKLLEQKESRDLVLNELENHKLVGNS